MYYKKYRPANVWKQLGLIGDALDFTDDPIVTSQGIGHSMYITGDSCPMDAAVVYTLLSHGPDRDVNAKQMLNQFTRTAYLFEEGKVADGYWKVPEETVHHTCGNDNGIHYSYSTSSYSNIKHTPKINPSLFNEFIAEVIARKDNSMLSALHDMYNWESSFVKRVIERIATEYTEYSSESNEPFKVLLGMPTTTSNIDSAIMVRAIDRALPDNLKSIYNATLNQHTLCSGTDELGYCDIHNPRTVMFERDWVYKNGLPSLYSNEIISSYSSGRPHLTQQECNDTEKYNDNKRALINSVDDKLVTRCINKSLTRMINSRRVSKTSHGRGRTFQWNAWGWLEEIRSAILASDSMKRKIGDEVNGWVYSKGQVKETHGMEIVSYVWLPKEEVKTYKVQIEAPLVRHGYGSTHNLSTTTASLPFIFMSKDEAYTYANSIQLSNENLGIPISRTIDEEFNVTILQPEVKVVSQVHKMAAEGTVVIEQYQDPTTMYITMQRGSQAQYSEVASLLTMVPNKHTVFKKVVGE